MNLTDHMKAKADAKLRAENERLRQALQNIQDVTDHFEGRTVGQAMDAAESANEFARAALQGE